MSFLLQTRFLTLWIFSTSFSASLLKQQHGQQESGQHDMIFKIEVYVDQQHQNKPAINKILKFYGNKIRVLVNVVLLLVGCIRFMLCIGNCIFVSIYLLLDYIQLSSSTISAGILSSYNNKSDLNRLRGNIQYLLKRVNR